MLRSGEAEYRAFVEIDMGSMSMVRLGQKLAGYAAYYREEAWNERHPFAPVLLVFTTTSRRVESIINRFEDSYSRRGRGRSDYGRDDRVREPVAAACDAVRDPETALSEAIWLGRGGIDRLTLTDVLDPPWQRWFKEQAAARAEEERRHRHEEHLRNDAEARRAHLQTYVYPSVYEDPIGALDGQEFEAMMMLVRSTDPMSAAERGAFEFVERRLPAADEPRYAQREPQPPTRDERVAIRALVGHYLSRQKDEVASLYARYPQCPSLLRAIAHLHKGLLLSSLDEEYLEQHVRDDLKAMKRLQGRKLDYLAWRKRRIQEDRTTCNAVERLLFDGDARAREIDHGNLQFCQVCEQVAIPTEPGRAWTTQCPFCGRSQLIDLREAEANGLVQNDREGFWGVCHRPVPAWASSEMDRLHLGPALHADEEDEP